MTLAKCRQSNSGLTNNDEGQRVKTVRLRERAGGYDAKIREHTVCNKQILLSESVRTAYV